jgi:hypothetical protein
MDAKAVRAVLLKFKKDQYPLLLERWRFAGGLRDTVISGPKHNIVRILVGASLKHGIEEDDLSEAEMIYHQLNVTSKRWVAFTITKRSSRSVDEAQLSIPEIIEDKLHRHLTQFYHNAVCALSLRDSIWLRVAILEIKPSIYYLIYHPHSCLLLTTRIKQEHQKFIFHVS